MDLVRLFNSLKIKKDNVFDYSKKIIYFFITRWSECMISWGGHLIVFDFFFHFASVNKLSDIWFCRAYFLSFFLSRKKKISSTESYIINEQPHKMTFSLHRAMEKCIKKMFEFQQMKWNMVLSTLFDKFVFCFYHRMKQNTVLSRSINIIFHIPFNKWSGSSIVASFSQGKETINQ